MKPKTPYQGLLEAVREYRVRVEHPRRIGMWMYKSSRLNEGWSLVQLAERVKAADQLGYRVEIRADNEGNLHVEYVKIPSGIGWFIG